jgi:hypothetical protein
MKTTDPRDPLDHKIDDLLARRPLQPGSDFTARVLAAAAELPAPPAPRRRRARTLLRFALPIAAAAAIAVTCKLAPFSPGSATSIASPPLSAADIQEIFLLEEGLAGLAQLPDEQLNHHDLLNTLDALYFDLQS